MSPRTLDFLVIGAGKSGTTTLWNGISSHPQISTPKDKERGFFNSDGRYAKGLDHFVRHAFAHAAPGDRLGTVTPGYMSGHADRLEQVVTRMAADVPDVRLVALLRDPIDRAVAHFRHGVRARPWAGASFDAYLAKTQGGGDRGILLHGQYGRILQRYLESFDRRQLLVLFTDDLEHRPAEVYRRVFAFLDVDPDHVPPDLETRHNRGGTRARVSPEALRELHDKMESLVFAGRHKELREQRRAFYWWTDHIWNVEPDDAKKDVSDELRRRLARYYLEDAELLAELIGAEPPWLASYRSAGEAPAYDGRRPPPVPEGWTCGPPDFVGVGAQRAGSTWWFDLVCAHPEVTPAFGTRKELQFFSRDYDRGDRSERVAELYAEQFPRPPGTITGEFSPGYMRTERVCALLHRAAPEARLLAILRDPVARLRSAVNRLLQKGGGAPLKPDQIRIEIEHSLYGMQLEQLLRHYDRDQVLVLQFERCVADPEGELRRTWEFLGLGPAPPPEALLDATPNRREGTYELDAALEAELRAQLEHDIERLRPLLPPDFDLSLWPSAAS